MSFLSCDEMLAAARSQNLSLAEAILRSDLAESRLTEAAACPAAMPPRWNRPIRQAEAMAGITLQR